MVMWLPSSLGFCSTWKPPPSISWMASKTFMPLSGLTISLPRKYMVTLALLPSPRKRLMCLTFSSRSCLSMLGLTFISFTSMVFLAAWRLLS